MQITKPIDFRCPSCGYQSRVQATTIIDMTHNPGAKNQLLSGNLNVISCPNCGTPSTASTPMIYHDPGKELLIAFVPMSLNMGDDQAEKFIGVLMNEVTSNMDSKLIKSYIFQPRRVLTMQGLVEQVLEADGITKEMQDAQRERARLAQMFLQTDPDTFEELVKEHDEKIDEEFFTTLSVIAQQTVQQGRPDMAEYVMGVQQRIAELSSAGQDLMQRAEEQSLLLEEVAIEIQGLGRQPTPAEIVDLVVPHADDNQRLQAYVGLARPIFDYNFFEELTGRMASVSEADRGGLETLRDELLQLTQVIDQQQEAEMQNAANLLRDILSHPEPIEAISASMGQIDEVFMAGLVDVEFEDS
ncbi:MAG: CpXC domain-containing protein, partial [Chloroflexota bacterium]